MFDGPKIVCTPIKTEQYLARYIVRKRETFSRIRFIQADSFVAELEDYSRLHKANCQWFDSECDAFFKDVVTDYDRAKVYNEEFLRKVKWGLYMNLMSQFDDEVKELDTASVNWSSGKKHVWIGLTVPRPMIDYLNENKAAIREVQKALLAIYRYDGEFIFDDDIPF